MAEVDRRTALGALMAGTALGLGAGAACGGLVVLWPGDVQAAERPTAERLAGGGDGGAGFDADRAADRPTDRLTDRPTERLPSRPAEPPLDPSLGSSPDAARQRLRAGRHLFGSPCELLLRHPAGAPPLAALREAWAGLAQIHHEWNAWKPGALTRVNRALARGEAVRPDPALAAVIRRAAGLEAASAGLFNPAIGRWVGAWGFHADVLGDAAAPSADRLARWAAAPPSLAQLEWRGDWLRSHHPGLQLDLGAYAKGVAIDAALDRLARHGVTDALVDLGGNLAAMGQGDGQGEGQGEGQREGAGTAAGWRIGIRDPFEPGQLVARLHTRGREAVVTSGSYERARRIEGEWRHHILDPATAAPAPGLVSVTVLHHSAGLADVAATALLVAGPARWPRVAERLGVREVLVVDPHGRVQVTAPLAPRLAWATAGWRRSVEVV